MYLSASHYPKTFNRLFLPLYGATCLLVAYGIFEHYGPIRDLALGTWKDLTSDLEAPVGAFLMGVLLFLIGNYLRAFVGRTFGFWPAHWYPFFVYGFVTGFFLLAAILSLLPLPFTKGRGLSLRPDESGMVCLLFVPSVLLLAWSYLGSRRISISVPIAGAMGIIVGIAAQAPFFILTGAAITACYVLLFTQTRTLASVSAPPGTDTEGLKRFFAQRPRFTFADVDGMAELKKNLLEAAHEVLSRRPNARNGILLYGPPATASLFWRRRSPGNSKCASSTSPSGRWLRAG